MKREKELNIFTKTLTPQKVNAYYSKSIMQNIILKYYAKGLE